MLIELIPEMGHFALILALLMALVQASVPLAGTLTRRPLWMAYARPMALGQFVFVLLAYASLTASYLLNDFSVANVAHNANTMLPWYYKLSAVWGNHEGSMLLWCLILAGWTLAVARFSRSLPEALLANSLAVLGAISSGFLTFVLLTSNPFTRLLPGVPTDGADLNPLLQDIGLIVHPPMLYMGYVGFAVAFAVAIAALIEGRLESAWTRWVRPWTNIAWAFLTLGIALGSWWAYYELGWGGWWFWDPVENASLLPWLCGTALIHSLAVTEKRGGFKSWTLLLAIASFSLSLLGTFLVRSGVLTSVHAFANDPSRGLFILLLLGVTVGGSLLLFALRAPRIGYRTSLAGLSRETLLLLNNLLLVTMTASVLLGTLYPMLLDALGLGKISVGAPYFNTIFVPLTVLLCVFMGLGPLSQWKRASPRALWQQCWPAACLALLVAALVPLIYRGQWNLSVSLGLASALWIVLPMLRGLMARLRRARSRRVALGQLSRTYWGMLLAHFGVAITIIGVTVVSHYAVERNVRMAVGDSVQLAGHTFTLTELGERRGPNFTADTARLEVHRTGAATAFTMHPEKRLYLATGMPMTHVALAPGPLRDLYVAMGEELEPGSWALRLQYKPLVRWLWGGGLLMALGGLLAVSDRRYRRASRRLAATQLPDQETRA